MAHRTLNERDLAFYLYEMLGADELLTRPRYADHSRETFDAAMATAKTSHLRSTSAVSGRCGTCGYGV